MASIFFIVAFVQSIVQHGKAMRIAGTSTAQIDEEGFLKFARNTEADLQRITQLGAASGVPQNWTKTTEDGIALAKAAPAMLKALKKRDDKITATMAIVMDLLSLILGAIHGHHGEDERCPLTATVVNLLSYWLVGPFFISKALPDTFTDDWQRAGATILKLTESFSSVGYGGWSGDLVSSNLNKFAHACHTWVGTAIINGYMTSIFRYLMKCVNWSVPWKVLRIYKNKDGYGNYVLALMRFIFIVMIGSVLSMTVTLTEGGGKTSFSDALYFTLMTGSTVGYGDLFPRKNSPATLGSAIIWMPLLTVAFDRFKDAGNGKISKADMSAWRCQNWFTEERCVLTADGDRANQTEESEGETGDTDGEAPSEEIRGVSVNQNPREGGQEVEQVGQ